MYERPSGPPPERLSAPPPSPPVASGAGATHVVIKLADALVVRPGDSLIVRFDPDQELTQEDVGSIKDEILRHLPSLARVVVLVADELAVERPEHVVVNGVIHE